MEYNNKRGDEMRLEDWKLSEVSLHMATRPQCAVKVAQLRAEELTQVERNSYRKRLWKSKEKEAGEELIVLGKYFRPMRTVQSVSRGNLGGIISKSRF